MKIRINFDGACNNHLEHPPAGVGIAVFIDGIYDAELSLAIPIMPNQLGIRNTNNTTEWQGCIWAMKTLKSLASCEELVSAAFEVFSDSQVVTQVFNGKHETHTPEFKKYCEEAHKIVDAVMFELKIQWVPREQNKEADKLSKEGLKLALDKLVTL